MKPEKIMWGTGRGCNKRTTLLNPGNSELVGVSICLEGRFSEQTKKDVI